MIERIPFESCPLCETTALVDCATGNCSGHPLYQSPLSPWIYWKQCTACLHIFTAGHYSDAACALIYERTNDNQQVGYGLEQQRPTSARMIDKIVPFADQGTWLDVGFGNGSLLFTAQEYGYTPIGLDVRADNVARLRSLGIEAHTADITTISLKSPCAVISMADVLEHIPYPVHALTAAHRLLADDGILFVSMPNSESMLWRTLDQQNANPYWGEIEHYHNFSRTRLYALLREYNFEPLRYGISERYRACMEVIARKR